ncbi:MAG: hypothetical protein IJV98_03060 [Clostridia bacterium]|nr:hypothetical protein [Clostridia bacterium]
MFDEKEIAAYRGISAPRDLRDKVLSSCTAETTKRFDLRRMTRMVSSIAACLLLATVLTTYAFGSFDAPRVSVSDRVLNEQSSLTFTEQDHGIAVAMYREVPVTTVPLTFDGHATLRVSGGVMDVIEDGEILYSGTEYTTDGKTLVHWTVSGDETSQVLAMTVIGRFKTETIVLRFDDSNDCWIVSRETND